MIGKPAQWVKSDDEHKLLTATITGLGSLSSAFVVWVVVVMLLDRKARGYETMLWAGSLWLSAISCTAIVAYLRFNKWPVLGCTLAFAIFSVAYLACEGPIFGAASEGGDPATTNAVMWNLIGLPLGVFLASDLASQLGAQRSRRNADETQSATDARFFSPPRPGTPRHVFLKYVGSGARGPAPRVD